jgi:opacity protein-like surface antigen
MRRVAIVCLLLLFAVVPAQRSLAGVGFGLHGNLTNFRVGGELGRVTGLSSGGSTTTLALKEVYGLGYGGGVHIDFGIPILTIRISGDYLTLAPENEKFQTFLRTYTGSSTALFGVDGGRITMISGNANLKVTILPLPVFKPYITGGVGLANIRSEDLVVTFNTFRLPGFQLIETQTVTMFNAGVGLDLDFGAIAFFGEVKVNWVMLKEGTSVQVPIATAGITF